jgi:hypothetical protein
MEQTYLFVNGHVDFHTCLGTALEDLIQTVLLVIERRSLEKLSKVSITRQDVAVDIPVQVTTTSQQYKSSLLPAPVLLQRPAQFQLMLQGLG